jgi:hypothetical protein
MRTTGCLLLALTVGVLAPVGCGKSGEPKPAPLIPGAVNLSGIQQAFPAPTPEVTKSIDRLRFAVRYRTFDAALAELDKLSRLPNLTDQQKKAVNDTIAQVKVVLNTLPPKPAQ